MIIQVEQLIKDMETLKKINNEIDHVRDSMRIHNNENIEQIIELLKDLYL